MKNRIQKGYKPRAADIFYVQTCLLASRYKSMLQTLQDANCPMASITRRDGTTQTVPKLYYDVAFKLNRRNRGTLKTRPIDVVAVAEQFLTRMKGYDDQLLPCVKGHYGRPDSEKWGGGPRYPIVPMSVPQVHGRTQVLAELLHKECEVGTWYALCKACEQPSAEGDIAREKFAKYVRMAQAVMLACPLPTALTLRPCGHRRFVVVVPVGPPYDEMISEGMEIRLGEDGEIIPKGAQPMI